MSSERHKAKYKKLTEELMQHKHLYYVLCTPILSDYDYDILKSKRDALGWYLGMTVEQRSLPREGSFEEEV